MLNKCCYLAFPMTAIYHDNPLDAQSALRIKNTVSGEDAEGTPDLQHDDQVLQSFREGSEEALRRLFDRFYGSILHYAQHLLEQRSEAGADSIFHKATAAIKGKSVVVFSPDVTDPVAVRYAWAQNPTCNLVNTENLPASPFRTDDWDPETEKY